MAQISQSTLLSTGSRWLLAGAVAFYVAASAQADTPGFTLGIEIGPTLGFTGTRGFRFAPRPDREVIITQLGVFDSGGDGLVNSHEVGLWLNNPGNQTGTLLVSATVPAGTEAPLIDGFRWIQISPVYLQSGFPAYAIGAHYLAGDPDDQTKPHLPRFAADVGPSVENGLFAYGADLAYPFISTLPPSEGQLGEQFYQANFQYVIVPEPATWMLLSSAALLFLVRRRTQA